MSKEFIERDLVLQHIQDGLNYPDRTSLKAYGHDGVEIAAFVHFMPAADVVPAVHGRFDWNYRLGSGRKEAVCEKCKNDPYWYHHYLTGDEHYCPNCGAKMEVGAEDG